MPHPKLNGTPPAIGIAAPQLRYVKQDKSDASLADLKGNVVILLTVPSLDTSTCALETRTFDKKAADLGATVLVVSMDLPFAMKRFCATEGIENVETGSDFRFNDVGEKWGLRIAEGNMNGTLGRLVFVIDKQGVIRYSEQTAELGVEPDYEAALAAAKSVL